ncbi:MAG TPA: DUF2723 domain-containing protein, partial [Chloroflexi bacterium]|nr:DUF2723 domain-containing protein [Chloroflexota bacterium]
MTPIRSRWAGGQGSRWESEQVSPAHLLTCSPAHLLTCSLSPPLLVSLSAFALPLLVYLLTLPPGITWANHGADAGDLITAACTLGVPHPSGYPTYTLTGWLVCQIPLGSIAWRFNLLSAVGAAGGAWFLFKSVNLLACNVSGFRFQVSSSRPRTANPKPETRNYKPETRNCNVAGLVAAWSLAFTPLVWSQVIITEVYGVNLFFVGLLLWLGLQVRQGKMRYLFWLGLVFGLSLGVHLTNLFLLPMLAFSFQLSAFSGQRSAVSQQQPFTIHRLPFTIYHSPSVLRLFSFLPAFALGLLIFAYLPLRAGKAPVTWGTPDTLSGFWALVSGKIYHSYLFAAPLHLLDDRILVSLRHLTGGGIFILILAGLGLLELWRWAKDLFWLTLLTSSF